MSQLILQPFRRFTYVTDHSLTLPLLHLRRSSFPNPSFAYSTSRALHLIHLERFENEQGLFSNLTVTSPMSQLVLQPFRRFTYVTAHSPALPLLHLRHSSFSNPSFSYPTSEALHLIHLERLENEQNSFSNISVTSPTSQLILQPFRRFKCVTAHYPTLPLLHLRHS